MYNESEDKFKQRTAILIDGQKSLFNLWKILVLK